MRLNKFLSEAGVTSRRAADKLIAEGRVRVNKKVVSKLGATIDPEHDEVVVDGQKVGMTKKRVIYLLNKPKGVVTTANDPEGRKTVLDFVPSEPRVFPCGRLDYDSMGLVVLTNDGNLCYQLTHPKFEHKKEYIVEGTARSPKAALTKLETGNTRLNDGLVKIDHLKLIKMSKDKLVITITVHEGRNRLVRRLCAAVGIEVVKLTRIKLGHYELGNLKPGEYTALS